jgi:3-hydroxyisobutyrate dehydrogenase-like beta-hydroxyacid dehydrogenase
MQQERIGLIGLGRMGVAMGGRLLATGFPLAVWNRTRARAASLLEQGAAWADTPSALADRCDVVLTVVTDDAAVRRVYEGDDGLLAGDVSGKLFVEMSTVRADTIIALGREVASRGARLVDSPVSGTVGPAREGKLLALVGGEPEAVERARPVLAPLTRRIAHVGPGGSGTTMKLVLNLPMAIYWQGLAEALALGARAGLDRAQMLDLIMDSPAAIAALTIKRDAILGAVGEVAFDITGVRKDLLAMIATGQGLGVPMPAASAALMSFMYATAAGHGGDDLAALIPLFSDAVQRTAESKDG